MTEWSVGVGVVILLVLLAIVMMPRRAARHDAAPRRNRTDGAGFWITGDPGRTHPDRDRASSPDTNDTGTADAGDGGGGGGGGGD